MSEARTPSLVEQDTDGKQRMESSQGEPDLGAERTYLAYERTLMAWTRTSASLISFGFTIYKFFQAFVEHRQRHPLGYITFSVVMISVGLIALLLATLQHRYDTRQLESRYHLKPRYLAPVIAGLIAGLGVLGLVAVVLQQ